jgi:hypothetical protein
MDSETLKSLEAKYWEGRTSSEEDRALMTHASRPGSVLSEEIRHLMGAISEVKSVELGSDFDDAFWAKAEGNVQSKPLVLRMAVAFRYAAAILVAALLGLVLWLSLGAPKDTGQGGGAQQITAIDTYDDPEKAFEETKKALLLVSQKFNKGAEPVGEIKRFHTMQMSIAAESEDQEKK